MSDPKSPTPSQNERGREDEREETEGVPSAVNFVTKNTFRSQSNSPVAQTTVEDLWRRALKQEADFRIRYWAMIAGVVIVSVVAILAVVAPLAAQRDTFKEFDNRMASVEKKTDNTKSSALTLRRAPGYKDDYLSAMRSSRDCSDLEPLSPDSLGPRWTCASRDWDQWEASNGTLLTYFCSKKTSCAVMMTGKCTSDQWIYMSINNSVNCDCTRKVPNVLAWSNRRRKPRKPRYAAQSEKRDESELTESSKWKRTHCFTDPPHNWGCAVSDWQSKRTNLGYNPKSKGFLVNYFCRSESKGCTVTRTLECGENGTWKVVFTSSIVNDCRCEEKFLQYDEW